METYILTRDTDARCTSTTTRYVLQAIRTPTTLPTLPYLCIVCSFIGCIQYYVNVYINNNIHFFTIIYELNVLLKLNNLMRV